MQATCCQPVADAVVFERLRESPAASDATVCHLHPPRVPAGAEHRLLVLPPDAADLHLVPSPELGHCGGGDTTVHEGQFEPLASAQLGDVAEHEVSGSILVRGGGQSQRRDRQAGDIHRHHPLGSVGPAVGAAPMNKPTSMITKPPSAEMMISIPAPATSSARLRTARPH